MDEINKQITALVQAEVDKQTRGYKTALHEAIRILTTIAGDPELECDNCGEYFMPTNVKRHGYCSIDCKEKHTKVAETDDSSKLYMAYREIEKRKHVKLEPAVKQSNAAFVLRSEAQQNRRAIEKVVQPKTVKNDCKNCGKLTTKLYCSDDCRKEYEKSVIDAVAEDNRSSSIKITKSFNKDSGDPQWDKAAKESQNRILSRYE
ncbi:MAG: hypothetical protein H0X02_07330 [Nitrosomonas sp.]|nr:hypothetical protein [Nitrosomonas sp.]